MASGQSPATASERFGPGLEPPQQGPRTALRLEHGLPRQAEAHLERLRSGLGGMGADAAWLEGAWVQALAWARDEAGASSELALRLLADPSTDTLHVRLEAVPETPRPYLLLPMLHPKAHERGNPLSAFKGCLGPWHIGAQAVARQSGAQDALLLWPDDTLAETAIAVVGLLEGRRFILPPATGRVRSIAELGDLPAWADERDWEVLHAPIPLQAVREGQLWCFNALRGLWPAQTLN